MLTISSKSKSIPNIVWVILVYFTCISYFAKYKPAVTCKKKFFPTNKKPSLNKGKYREGLRPENRRNENVSWDNTNVDVDYAGTYQFWHGIFHQKLYNSYVHDVYSRKISQHFCVKFKIKFSL